MIFTESDRKHLTYVMNAMIKTRDDITEIKETLSDIRDTQESDGAVVESNNVLASGLKRSLQNIQDQLNKIENPDVGVEVEENEDGITFEVTVSSMEMVKADKPISEYVGEIVTETIADME